MRQMIFIPRYSPATLYRVLENKGGLQFVEGSQLLRDFHIGCVAAVGGLKTDWSTSNVKRIVDVDTSYALCRVFFDTRNTSYCLVTEAEFISYREDLTNLAKQTALDIDSDEWIKLIKEFRRIADVEYEATSKARR